VFTDGRDEWEKHAHKGAEGNRDILPLPRSCQHLADGRVLRGGQLVSRRGAEKFINILVPMLAGV